LSEDLDVDDPRLRANISSQSLHRCSIGYHPWHMSNLATKVYPCKHNQDYKQEQEECNQNCINHKVEPYKSMNNDTVRWQIWSKQNTNPDVATTAVKIEVRGCTTPRGTSNGLQHNTRPNGPTDGVAAPKQNLSANLFWWFPLIPDEF
jgi:hypothetical protein